MIQKASRFNERNELKLNCQELSLFSCPGRMFANSIPARLVAKRMRVALPRASACPCHVHAHGHTMRACAWPYHAHAQGYESFSDVGEIRVYFASKILTPCRMH